jgi:hypothetical protein
MESKIPLLVVCLQKCFKPKETLVSNIKAKIGEYENVYQTKLVPKNPLYGDILGWDTTTMDCDLCLPNEGTIVSVGGYTLEENVLDQICENNEISEVHLCGMLLDSSILALCYQLWDKKKLPKIIFDLTGDEENRLETRAIWMKNFGVVSRNKV